MAQNEAKGKQLAPEPILRAALHVLHMASCETRNWTLNDDVSRKQINDLWEALHPVPATLCDWRDDNEQRLFLLFRCYDNTWPDLKLCVMYEDELARAANQPRSGDCE